MEVTKLTDRELATIATRVTVSDYIPSELDRYTDQQIMQLAYVILLKDPGVSRDKQLAPLLPRLKRIKATSKENIPHNLDYQQVTANGCCSLFAKCLGRFRTLEVAQNDVGQVY